MLAGNRLGGLNLDSLDAADIAAFDARRKWISEARHPDRKGKQLPPQDNEWIILIFRAGRGFGKTISMTNWGFWESWRLPGFKDMIGHAIAPTQADVRGTLFEGPTGFRATIPAECLKDESWDKAFAKGPPTSLTLKNGAIIKGFAATEEGDRLRGPQCHWMICDEIGAWDKPAGNLESAINNALMGLRLVYPDGTPARAVMGTTPPIRPVPYMKRLEKMPGTVVVRGTTYENLRNMSPSLAKRLLTLVGTQAGRREIEAEYLDEDEQTAILKRGWLKLWPHDRKLPEFSFIIESYDTAYEERDFDKKKQRPDPTASLILGVFNPKAYFTEQELRRMGVRSKTAALLCDVWTDFLGFPDLLTKAREQHRMKWGSPGRRSDIVLIEEKASGKSLRQSLVTHGVPTWPYNPGNQSKTVRAHAISPLVKQGMLWLPESSLPDRRGMPRNWCDAFTEEVCAFSGPGTTEHDDQVDALTSAMLYLRDRGILEDVPETVVKDYEEMLAKKQEDAERAYGDQRMKVGNPYAA